MAFDGAVRHVPGSNPGLKFPTPPAGGVGNFFIAPVGREGDTSYRVAKRIKALYAALW